MRLPIFAETMIVVELDDIVWGEGPEPRAKEMTMLRRVYMVTHP